MFHNELKKISIGQLGEKLQLFKVRTEGRIHKSITFLPELELSYCHLSALSECTNNSLIISVLFHLNRRVGVAVTDVDFLNIDINPCSRYPDDDGDNYLGGIDRCHKLSTIVSYAEYYFYDL